MAILHKKKIKPVVLSAILLSFLTHCSIETSNTLPQEPQREAASISIVSGNNQSGQAEKGEQPRKGARRKRKKTQY